MTTRPLFQFSQCLQQSLIIIGSELWLWIGVTIAIAGLLVLGRPFPILGVFNTIMSVFLCVGLAKYCDLKHTHPKTAPTLSWVIKTSLPLAILVAIGIDLCWFVFMTAAYILSGAPAKIMIFFVNWQVLQHIPEFDNVHNFAAWLFTYANIALSFGLLILSAFVGWFTHPLMLFNNTRFSKAKQKSANAASQHRSALVKTIGFIIFQAFLCSTVTPLLTPVLLVLTGCLIYNSYKVTFA